MFAYGGKAANNRLGFRAEYYWLNGRGDTVHVRTAPGVSVDHLGQHAAGRDGRYYVGGMGDGSGTGQSPLALHYALVCLDTLGNLRWQRQYPNPAIRLGPTEPNFVGGYAYLQQVVEAPRRGWLLLGHTQRDSVNFQLYAIEVDSGGQLRRTRWVEPFGRRATAYLHNPATALALRDGSGYVLSGEVQLDSLGRGRTHGFVARLDTALRVVWRVLLEAPAGATAGRRAGPVQEAADGSLRVLTYPYAPRGPANEFELLHFSAQGQLTRRATYCSQVCTQVTPDSWQLLPGDTAVLVSGWGQVRRNNAPTGQLLAQPAWLARFAQPCRTQVVSAAAPGRAPALAGLYPQPAAPGAVVTLTLARPGQGPVEVELLDALGRAVPVPAEASGATELRLTLPAGLAPGLYAVRVRAAGPPVATGKLLVQVP